MRLHLRFDRADAVHAHATLFVNGASAGQLCFRAEEAIWFHHILDAGCDRLSPAGKEPIRFMSSGIPPDPPPEAVEAVVQSTPKGYP
jgi:hypothetical protein